MTNQQCKVCLQAQHLKMIVCIATLIDLAMTATSLTLLIQIANGNLFTVMLAVLCIRSACLWVVFAVAVTTLNRIINCQTGVGGISWKSRI